MKSIKWILFGLVLFALLVVVFRNLEQTKVELIFTSVDMPLAAILLITLLLGFVLGLAASALWKMRNWRVHSKALKNAKQTDSPQTD